MISPHLVSLFSSDDLLEIAEFLQVETDGLEDDHLSLARAVEESDYHTRDLLGAFPKATLQRLCELMQLPKSGNKPDIISRIETRLDELALDEGYLKSRALLEKSRARQRSLANQKPIPLVNNEDSSESWSWVGPFFLAPGKFILWWEYHFPRSGNVLASARRKDNPTIQILYSIGFWAFVAFMIVILLSSAMRKT